MRHQSVDWASLLFQYAYFIIIIIIFFILIDTLFESLECYFWS